MRHATPSLRRFALVALTLVAGLGLGGCGYNDFQRLDEGVKAAWSEVINNYQRRADLIPNLVSTVQGAADFEKSTLVELTNARASVSAIKATPELINDPQAFAKFQAVQSQMTGALRPLPKWRREDLQLELGEWHPPPVVTARRAPRAAAS